MSDKEITTERCRRGGCPNDAEPLHVCPFAVEIYDDHEILCRCCEECEQTCRDDV